MGHNDRSDLSELSPSDPPLAYTVGEAAARLRVHPDTVRRMVKRGGLPVVYVGDRPFIPCQAIERMFLIDTPLGDESGS